MYLYVTVIVVHVSKCFDVNLTEGRCFYLALILSFCVIVFHYALFERMSLISLLYFSGDYLGSSSGEYP